MSAPDVSPPLNGLRVAAFESRMAGPMSDLIRKHGGEPIEAPALREIPIGCNPQAIEFAKTLIAGGFDLVIFLTGVGTRYLLQEIEPEIEARTVLDALARVTVVARGPKPLAVLREWKVRVDLQVPEPNTWRDILAALDTYKSVHGLRVAVQEYGKPAPELISGLIDRGAIVTSVPVYRWALPEDTGPLRRAIREIGQNRIDVALFTSAQQVVHLLQIADEEGLGTEVRGALRDRVLVGSIGPTTSETLREQGLERHVEPEHPKMGHLVAAVARAVQKGWFESVLPGPIVPATVIDNRVESNLDLPRNRMGAFAMTERLYNSPFMKACRREPTDVTPVWLMRQAGRYMAEYRAVRSKVGFLELCHRPELACEVTVTAAERLGVDAAILFADILLILQPIGFDLEFAKGEGPIIHNPIREAKDVDRVRPLTDPEPLRYVFEAVRLIRAALKPDLPLIGFAGAPFTLACYAIEGGASRHYDTAKGFMYRDPGAWDALMSRLVDATVVYLNAQADAGAQVLQLFDSWVGNLSPDDYRRFVQPHMARLFKALRPGVPTIHFGTDTGSLLTLQRDAGGDVIGLDWRVELDRAWERLGPEVAVQGNLDPVLLLAPISELKRQVTSVLARAAGRPGHIFNLGHGILPHTPVDHVLALVDTVHSAPRHA
ncbi:MAG: uroporphyrinogen decarboxylase [Planctomycetota bacterium]|nr:uroporphyrinogen decarboxylase [Planctomycetota bacterium]